MATERQAEPSPEARTLSGSWPTGLLSCVVMVATVLVTYGAIVWILRRGFDWTDEAFVTNLTSTDWKAAGEPWGFQHLLHPLYVVTGQSVLALRIVRLLGYLLLSIFLVWSARSILRRTGVSIPRSGWVFILLMAQVGTFFAWSSPPQYLGYNELASWFVQSGVALILLSLAWGVPSPLNQGRSRALRSIWATLGAVLTLLMIAKVTSGLAFGAFLALAVLIPNPGLRLWRRIAAAVAGAAAALLVLWLCRVPIGFYFTNMKDLLFDPSARAAVGRPLSGMIQVYGDSLVLTGRALLPALLTFALLAGTYSLNIRPNPGRPGRWAMDGIRWTLGILLVAELFTLPTPGVWVHLGILVTFVGAAGLIGLAILGAGRVAVRRPGAPTLLSGMVAGAGVGAAPFISAAGTSNPIAVEFVFAATLWAVVLGIVLVLLAERGTLLRSSARLLPGLIGCVVVLIAALAVRAYIANPYRNPPLLTQDTSTSVPELRGLLLTRTDAAWIDWVAAAGDALGADEVPATAVNSAGALYAFNHSGYANPWVGTNWPAAFRSLTAACSTHKPADLFVLQPGTSTKGAPSTSGVTKSLAACGIAFPGDFRVVARRDSADPERAMTIWRLKSR